MAELPKGFRVVPQQAEVPEGFRVLGIADKAQQAQRDLAAGLSGPQARLVSMGSAVNDVGENLQRVGQRVGEFVGVLGPQDRARQEAQLTQDDDAFRLLQEEQPVNAAVGRGIAQAGMFAAVPGGVAGGGIQRAMTGAASGGSVAALSTGADESPYTNFSIGVVGGALAPSIAGGLSRAITRLARKPMQVIVDGKFTDEALAFLEKHDIAPDKLTRETALELRKVGALTREQAERLNLFREFDPQLSPTQAQLTRTRTDFVNQQQAAKQSNVISTALDEQEKVIRENVDNMITGFGGRAVDSVDASNALASATQNRINAADEAISDTYTAIREALPTQKVVRPSELVKTLKSYASDETSTGGMLSSIMGDLERRGIVADGKVQGRISAEVAESVRKNINAIINESPSSRSRIGRLLKEAFDNDVERAVGEDLFAPARAAKSKLERSLERARRTRRDAGPDTLLEKVIENRVNPDQLIPDIMARTKIRAEDVEQYVAFLKSGDAGDIQQGMEALQELRSGIVRELLQRSNNGSGVTEQGTPIFSGAKFGANLDNIGNRKLAAIFDEDQLSLLGRLRRIGDLRTPLPGTQQGTGPSGLAMEIASKSVGDKLTQLGDKVTFGFASAIRELTRTRQEVAAARQMLQTSQPTEAAIRAARSIRARPAPAAAGAVTADRLQEEK